MSMDVNAVQELNADSLMTVTLLGMETEVSPVQLAKAPFSIFFYSALDNDCCQFAASGKSSFPLSCVSGNTD